jgi:hypothetical protein
MIVASMKSLLGLTGVLVLLAAAAPAGAQYSSTPDTGTLQTNGTVNTILRSTDRVYLGGAFSRVGFTAQQNFAALDPATGTASAAFPQANGTINAVVGDGAGGFYVGGTFTRIGNVARNRLAHITSTGSIGAFNPALNDSVRALALSGSTLYAGGSFTQVNTNSFTRTRNRLAAFDTTLANNNATGFDPDLNSTVLALALSGTTLYAGGFFTTVNTFATLKPRSRLAAFDTTIADTNNATAFDPSPNGNVFALALSGGTLYAGGSFTSVNTNATTKTRSRLAAFDTAAATDNATAFDPSPDSTVYTLALSGSALYAGGDFIAVNTNAATKTRNYLAAFDTTTDTDNATAFDPSPNSTVNALALSGSTLYAGGGFTAVNTSATARTRSRLAAFDTTTDTDNATGFNPDADGTVNALALSGGALGAGGSFTFAGSPDDAPRNNLAAITVAGNTLSPFDPSPDSLVNALALSGGTLYAGGGFSQVNTNATAKPRGFLAAFDTTLATDNATPFDPSPNGPALALALSGSTLYAGGSFTQVNTNATVKTRNRLAAFDTTLAADNATAFDPSADSPVFALALSGGTLYAGGQFTQVNSNATSKTRNRLAAFDTTTAADNATAFDPSLSSDVNALALSGSTLYAGGSFTSVNTNATSKPRNRIAAFDTTTATNNATPFNPSVGNSVFALALSGSTLYAGGAFTTVNTNATFRTRNRIAAFDTTTATGNVTAFNPDLNGTVNALALGGAKTLYAGGTFTSRNFGPVGPRGFAQFSDAAVPTAAGWGRARVTRRGRRAVISWRAGSRADVAGYSVMRARRGSNRRVRISRRLILGGALAKRSAYRVVDRHARRGDRYFVREHTTSGRIVNHGPLVARR